jgi:hypothetical protein
LSLTSLSENLFSVEISVAAAEAGVGEDAVPQLADEGCTLAAPRSHFRREAEEDVFEKVVRQIGQCRHIIGRRTIVVLRLLGGAVDDHVVVLCSAADRLRATSLSLMAERRVVQLLLTGRRRWSRGAEP